jgi:preprotein translocase subunit SecB
VARRKQQPKTAPPIAAIGEDATSGQSGVVFVRFWVSKCEMSEVAKLEPPPKEKTPNRFPIELAINAGVKVSSEGPAFSILTVAAKGDPHYRPYEVAVEVVGEFVAQQGHQADMILFCREVAPTILFPYARQIIDRMTSDGRFGALRINPINVRAVLSRSQWEENPTNPREQANVPRRPSSQSPSASRA